MQEGSGRAAASTERGKKEGRVYEYWFLILIRGEELIPRAMRWWEEGRASLTTVLCHGGGYGLSQRPKLMEMFCVCRWRRGLLFPALESGEGQSAEDVWWLGDSVFSLESHSSAYLMSYRASSGGSLSLGVLLKDAVCETSACWVPAGDRHQIGQPFSPRASAPTTALSLSQPPNFQHRA